MHMVLLLRLNLVLLLELRMRLLLILVMKLTHVLKKLKSLFLRQVVTPLQLLLELHMEHISLLLISAQEMLMVF